MNQRLVAGLNGLHALLLGVFAFSALALSIDALLKAEGTLASSLISSAFRISLFFVTGIAFAVYQLRWSRRIWRGEVATASGFVIAGVMLLGVGYFSLGYAAPTTIGRLFVSLDLHSISPLLNAFFALIPQLIALATIAQLNRQLTGIARLAALLGGFAVALGLEALLGMVGTAPALLGSGAALSLTAQLAYTPPALAIFAGNVAFAPFGASGSGGELWPIALVVALTLPVALLVLRAGRTLLGGTPLSHRAARLLGLLIIVASLAPFSGDRLSLALPEFIWRSSLVGLVFGLALLLLSLRRRALIVPLLGLGVFAVLLQAGAWLTASVPPSEVSFAVLINGIVARLAPEQLPSTSMMLLISAVLIGLLVRAGFRDERGARGG